MVCLLDFVLFFLVATKSKNSKAQIDVRIFIRIFISEVDNNLFCGLITDPRLITREKARSLYGDVRCDYTNHVIKPFI